MKFFAALNVSLLLSGMLIYVIYVAYALVH